MPPEVDKTFLIKVKSFEDLARMAASSVALGQPTYLLRYESRDKVIYGLLAVFRDYYKFYGIPIFYYYVDNGKRLPTSHNYVVVRTEEGNEYVELSRGSKPGYITIPIVNLEVLPDFLKADDLK